MLARKPDTRPEADPQFTLRGQRLMPAVLPHLRIAFDKALASGMFGRDLDDVAVAAAGDYLVSLLRSEVGHRMVLARKAKAAGRR